MKQKKLVEGLFWIFFAAAILVIFSARTSPAYSLLYGDYTGNEASHAMLVGKYWIRGVVPYKDLYLVGSPVYFAIQALGWLLGGRIGILCLQIINFVVYLYFTKKASELFVENRWAIVYTVFSAFPYGALCSGGNSPEEWSLSILSIMMWIIFSECRKTSLNNIKLILMGVGTGILLLLQWQALGIAIAGILCLGIFIIQKKEYKKILCLLCGFMIPIVMIGCYFYQMDCLKEMINCALIYPIRMQWDAAFESTAVILHKLVKCCFCVPLLLVGIWRCKKDDKRVGLASILIAVCYICSFMCNDNNWVHFIIAMPIISVALSLFGAENKKKCIINLGFMICYAVLCLVPFKAYIRYLMDGVQDGASEFYGTFVTYIEEYPDNRWMMIDTDSSYLLEADEEPVVKYFAMQTELAEYDEIVKVELEKYVSSTWGADVLIASERRWGNWNSEEYVLTQVYLKYRGNISIYVPYAAEE